MTYGMRMHNEVRDWLTSLRDTEPELARRTGEAVLALLDAGEKLTEPLVVPLASVLDRPQDPREALDYSYQRQLEMLTQVRRGVADVATSGKRLELQADTLERQLAKLAGQREAALRDGREDLAAVARDRETAIQEQLFSLRRQHATLAAEEEELFAASQRLQAKVEAFRMRKETIKATFTADEAAQRVRQAVAEMAAEAGEDPGESDVHGVTFGAAGVPVEDDDPEVRRYPAPQTAAGATAEGETLEQEIRDSAPDTGRPAEVSAPRELMVLRPGAPDELRCGLLFVLAAGDEAVLLAGVEGTAPGDYAAALPTAVARMGSASGLGAADAFLSYRADSFLDEFFPGAETEVEIGAAALVARNRAHTLAEARRRMRMTQAQVAERMEVRQERVSAIERAEPGATEVRTLAAYVRALGGRLEIVAHVGSERIILG